MLDTVYIEHRKFVAVLIVERIQFRVPKRACLVIVFKKIQLKTIILSLRKCFVHVLSSNFGHQMISIAQRAHDLSFAGVDELILTSNADGWFASGKIAGVLVIRAIALYTVHGYNDYISLGSGSVYIPMMLEKRCCCLFISFFAWMLDAVKDSYRWNLNNGNVSAYSLFVMSAVMHQWNG